jgi:4-amino-4-deoxy-L-arabinose transferase-like glycosyltransferase
MGTKVDLKELAVVTVLAIAWVAIFRPGPLSLPYFWDEADVYVPGARLIAESGFTYSPSELSDDYSRGHPPLFYLVAAVAFAAFGAAPAVGHLVVLPFTVLALVGTYLLGVRLWDRRVGAAAALLLGATPLFMSMGNMMLPEMALTAAAVWGFLAIAHGRLGWAAAAGVFGVLLKETGLAAPAAVGVIVLYDAWERGELRAAAPLRRSLVATIPLFALCLFFVWQKLVVGYFIFPHHADLLVERPFGISNLFTVFPSLFAWHGRWVLVVAAILASWLGSSVLRVRLRLDVTTERWMPSRGALLVGFAALVLLNALFFSKMFWLERYVLPAHPAVILAATFLVVVGMEHLPVLAALPAAVGIAMGLANLWSDPGPDQEELSFAYANVIATHREAFAAIEGDAPHVLTTWPMTVELENPYLGYVDEPIESTNVRYVAGEPEVTPSHVLISSASSRADALREIADAQGLSPVGRFRVGHAPSLELYAR